MSSLGVLGSVTVLLVLKRRGRGSSVSRVVLLEYRSGLLLMLVLVLWHLVMLRAVVKLRSLIMLIVTEIRTWEMNNTPRWTLSAYSAFNAMHLFRHPIPVPRRSCPHISRPHTSIGTADALTPLLVLISSTVAPLVRLRVSDTPSILVIRVIRLRQQCANG